jgi:hypothetical protein
MKNDIFRQNNIDQNDLLLNTSVKSIAKPTYFYKYYVLILNHKSNYYRNILKYLDVLSSILSTRWSGEYGC